MKIQNDVFGESQDYNTKMSRQEKGSPWQKNLCSSNYAFLTKVQYVLTLLRTILKTFLVARSRHNLF